MATATAPRSDYLTRNEAAAYIAMRPQTLAAWATLGRHDLPYVKVGRSVRYRLADLDAWLASRTVTHTGQL
ncbi:MAG: helix-turn-helix domain-containing protein [Pirellulales bacterium]|nr:helix-turn-helix domain-containing protein [Pirellulales bacterium]